MSSISNFYRERQSVTKLSTRKMELIKLISPYLRKEHQVLDVGCGDGFITSCLGLYCDIYGVDINAQGLNERYHCSGFSNFNLINNDIPENIDIILFLDVLEHINEKQETFVLKKLSEACKMLIINIPVHQDEGQPIDRKVNPLTIIKKLDYFGMHLRDFTSYMMTKGEQYKFMVFSK